MEHILILNDARGFKKIFLASGYTNLRREMEGLATIIRFQFEQLYPYNKNILFLFCRKRSDRIKGLLWDGDGLLLLYKRLYNDAFNWPLTESQEMKITSEQYRIHMKGFAFVVKHPIKEMKNPPKAI